MRQSTRHTFFLKHARSHVPGHAVIKGERRQKRDVCRHRDHSDDSNHVEHQVSCRGQQDGISPIPEIQDHGQACHQSKHTSDDHRGKGIVEIKRDIQQVTLTIQPAQTPPTHLLADDFRGYQPCSGFANQITHASAGHSTGPCAVEFRLTQFILFAGSVHAPDRGPRALHHRGVRRDRFHGRDEVTGPMKKGGAQRRPFRRSRSAISSPQLSARC